MNDISPQRRTLPATLSVLEQSVLDQFSPPPRRQIDAHEAARTVLGVALVVLSGGVCVWLVLTIHRLISGSGSVSLLTRLMPRQASDLAITIPSGRVQLPPHLMTVAGYGIAVLLLLIAAWLAIAFLKAGISLLLRRPYGKPIETP